MEKILGKEIAVLLATYNGARFLVEQLDSLRAQTCQDWLSNYLRDNGYDKVPFAGIADARTDADRLSNMILEQLDLSADWALRYNKVDVALKHLTVLMEDRGVTYVGHQG